MLDLVGDINANSVLFINLYVYSYVCISFHEYL